jgi:hypothetical protein
MSGKLVPGVHWIGGSVGLATGLDVMLPRGTVFLSSNSVTILTELSLWWEVAVSVQASVIQRPPLFCYVTIHKISSVVSREAIQNLKQYSYCSWNSKFCRQMSWGFSLSYNSYGGKRTCTDTRSIQQRKQLHFSPYRRMKQYKFLRSYKTCGFLIIVEIKNSWIYGIRMKCTLLNGIRIRKLFLNLKSLR